MNGNNLKSMKDLMGEFSQQKTMAKPMQEARVVNIWPDVVGKVINKYTEKIFVKNKVLYVQVQHAALKNELIYMQEQIIEKVNKELAEEALVKMILL